ncbi:hypothetical protein Aph02nite_76820 [Actinoplanes philippinensis]|uniref:Superoxide dismutase n=1 Tax=Actinoplanes philippinensis TaxID=35752 RepID=A0A1I2HFL3_9ACTN|nr:hypothetical protein [Actinoplanes philippinensis]GIE81732.1 hypothetical protein Aph02nite_76820 [Actinoplanes philippinensis]SFF28328.1 hypothetical protein SAMN05421541_108122 [Actinoplanes philippinensis]
MTPDSAALLAGMQRALGIIAARHHGDVAGAQALAAEFTDDAERAHAFLLLTEVSLTLVSGGSGRPVPDVVRDLSLRIAALAAAD